MCDRAHRYTIEAIGQPARYAGTDEDEAISALLTIRPDSGEEGYAVAEHDEGGSTSYCRPETQRIESEALRAADHMERQWADATAAFHGEGPYATANQDS